MKFKKKISKFTKKIPLLHKTLVFILLFPTIYIRPFIYYLLKKEKNSSKQYEFKKFIGLQKIKSVKINSLILKDKDNLIKSLQGYEFQEGGWTIYIKNISRFLEIEYINGLINENIDQIGIKILINDKNKPKDSYGLRPFGKTSNVKEILRVGNLLFLNKLGPKIYDLILLEDDFKNTAYAFLVQDIKTNESKKINDEEHSKLLKKIETLKFLQPTFRNIKNSDDFKIDNNKENIIKSANDEIMFLDFQSFNIINEYEYLKNISLRANITSFGRKRILKNQFYIYQTIPGIQQGKRDTYARWEKLDEIFKNCRIDITDKVFLDVGCNLGLNCYYALSKGASFVFGIDTKEISEITSEFLNALGCTRYQIFGLDLNAKESYQVFSKKNISKTNILIYSSIAHHIGYPSEIGNLNFEYILFEGKGNSTIQENLDDMKDSGWIKENNYSLLYSNYLQDGDSAKRPYYLLKRNLNI